MPYEQPPQDYGNYPQIPYTPEGAIDNIVEQINPAQIIDNFDHALKGEFFNKEKGQWEMNASGDALVNDACRGAIISYLTGILNNASTMGIIDKNQMSGLMESVIESINRMFVVNLERFGFVPPGKGYTKKDFENKGTPDSARMTMVSNMIFGISFLVYSRSLGGMESRKIFHSLSMTDIMGKQQQEKQSNWMGKMFAR